MKFDDTDEDYFLHDFSKDAAQQQNAPQQPQQGASPSFDFSDTRATSPATPSAPPRKRRRGCFYFFLALFFVAAGALYVRYCVPYIVESTTTGYVTLVEKRGIIFHTFEGEMVSRSLLTDTARVYTRDIYFSIPSDSLAYELQKYQSSGKPVTITYSRYYGTLPWRGASNTVLTSFRPATPQDQ